MNPPERTPEIDDTMYVRRRGGVEPNIGARAAIDPVAAPRAVAPDVVRAVAIALVVMLHTAGVVANPAPRVNRPRSGSRLIGA